MIHELKIQKEYFEQVISNRKTFEVRKNDRNYKVGDLLALNEIEDGKYTNRCCLVYVDYILDDENYCKVGFVTMSIKPCYVRIAKIGIKTDGFHCGLVSTDFIRSEKE